MPTLIGEGVVIYHGLAQGGMNVETQLECDILTVLGE